MSNEKEFNGFNLAKKISEGDERLKESALKKLTSVKSFRDMRRTDVARNGYFVSWRDSAKRMSSGIVVYDKSEVLNDADDYSVVVAHKQGGIFKYQLLEDLERIHGKENVSYYVPKVLETFK